VLVMSDGENRKCDFLAIETCEAAVTRPELTRTAVILTEAARSAAQSKDLQLPFAMPEQP
jgi:hypothetical protein